MKNAIIFTVFVFILGFATASPSNNVSDDLGGPILYLPGHAVVSQDPNSGNWRVDCLPPLNKVCVWINFDRIVTPDSTFNMPFKSYVIEGNTITIIPK